MDDIALVTGALPQMPNNEGFETANTVDAWVLDLGIWEIGKPTSGPGKAHSGENCLATVLAGNYTDGRISRMISPTFVVPAVVQNPRLRFWHWWSFAVPDFFGTGADFGRVQIRIGTNAWQTLSPDYTTDSSGLWTRASLDLSAYAGKTVQIAFYLVPCPA